MRRAIADSERFETIRAVWHSLKLRLARIPRPQAFSVSVLVCILATCTLAVLQVVPIVEIVLELAIVQVVLVLLWRRASLDSDASLLQVGQALDHASDAILVSDLDGRPRHCNRAFRRLFGGDQETVLRQRDWRSLLVYPGLADEILQHVREGQAWHGEVEMVLADESLVTLTLRADAVRDSIGRVRGMVAVHNDDSDRRRVAEQQRKFAALVEHSRDFIAMTSLSGEMIYLNPAGRRLVGLDFDGMHAGGHLTQYMSKASAEMFRDEVIVSVFAHGAWQGESQLIQFQTRDSIDVDANVFLVRDPDGNEPLCLAVILRDVRERRKAQHELLERAREIDRAHACIQKQSEELRTTMRSLEEANQAKAAFLANISHELRTPLTAVLGFSDFLIEELGPAETSLHVVAALKAIQRNGVHLLELINDVLDLSKIEAGKITLDRSVCRVRDFLDDIDVLFRERMNEKGLQFQVKTKGLLPETIVTDTVRLRQIVINLLGNALKFTEKGRVRLVVEMLRSDDSEAYLCLRVADTGIGIDSQTMDRLFEPFTQSETASRQFGGTGLGLNISRRLARLLGGDITAQSIPGVGSEFTLAIATGPLEGVPIVASDERNEKSATGGTTEDSLSTLGSPKLPIRILLAEDGKDNQRLLDFMLRKAGADVVVADDGLICIERFLEAQSDGKPFDVILMDMQMPVLDGYAATRQLRQRGCDIPIIALTASTKPGDREEAMEAGCTDYATKPIVRPFLFQTIAKHTIWDSSRFPATDRSVSHAGIE